ncbi:phosphatase 2C 29-like protein [Tanacetum coccineum]
MGVTFSHCFTPSKHQPETTPTDQPLDETLGHSFCYIRSSPSTSDRFTSPSHSLRHSHAPLKSISGASVSANALTPTISQDYAITELFESTSSFTSLPLQPLPRGDSARGAFFMSGPIERGGGLSGPLDSSNSLNLGLDNTNSSSSAAGIAYSAPLSSGMYARRKGIRGIRGIKKALSRSFPRPWVVPIRNGGQKEGAVRENNERDVQWALGKAGEDRVHVVVSEEHGWLFVGIYDGFNGPDAPEFLMGNLYKAMYKELEGLFWEVNETDLDRVNENVMPVKKVSFRSGEEIVTRRRRLWEFLAEEEPEYGLDLSGSERFAFSVDDALSVSKTSSGVVNRRSLLLSKLRNGFSKRKEGSKFFAWKFGLDAKEEKEAESRVEETDNVVRTGRKKKDGPVDHELVLKAMSKALEVTELAYLDMTDKVMDQYPELALMGSCLLAVLMRDEDVYVMNLGDSRAIVAQHEETEEAGSSHTGDSRTVIEGVANESTDVEREVPDQDVKLTALQLSTDHSTSIEEEVTRIKNEHPDDNHCIVNDRVKGRLKVTRAFGAGSLKQAKWNDSLLEMFRNEFIGDAPYISCLPSLRHHQLCPRDQFLILSSDGLYQYFSNQEVVSHVDIFMDKFPDGDPAQHLIEELLLRAAKKAGMDLHELLDIPQGDRRKYHDDVTVMVISLEGRIWKSSGKYL